MLKLRICPPPRRITDRISKILSKTPPRANFYPAENVLGIRRKDDTKDSLEHAAKSRKHTTVTNCCSLPSLYRFSSCDEHQPLHSALGGSQVRSTAFSRGQLQESRKSKAPQETTRCGWAGRPLGPSTGTNSNELFGS